MVSGVWAFEGKTASLIALVLPCSTVNSCYITLESFILNPKRGEVNTKSVECKKALWFPHSVIKRSRSSQWSIDLYLQLHNPHHTFILILIWLLLFLLCIYLSLKTPHAWNRERELRIIFPLVPIKGPVWNTIKSDAFSNENRSTTPTPFLIFHYIHWVLFYSV